MNMLRLFFILTVVTGVLYPLAVTLVGSVGFAEKARGSLLKVQDKVIGSSLLAQKFESENFFHPRPSAGDFATVASSASHSSVTNLDAHEKMLKRKASLPLAAQDLWTTSASGLDPHITPQSALAQMARVARARGMSEEALSTMILSHVEGPTWGIWGQPRVNVLELNRDLLKD